jgi:hypothetical protein
MIAASVIITGNVSIDTNTSIIIGGGSTVVVFGNLVLDGTITFTVNDNATGN